MRRIILGFGVLLALGAAATGAMAAPALEMVERPAILKTCAVVPDQELREIRGCYLDSYIFGLDIKIDLTTPPLPTIAVNFTGKVPPGSKAPTVNNSPVTLDPNGNFSVSPTITGNSLNVAFNTMNQDPVAYKVDIGKTQQFTGILQALQIKSASDAVLANTVLTFVVPKGMLPLSAGNSLVPALRTGVFH